ncbi:MAG: carboxypeptidase regulatory-like domain-containing protein [Bacteroidetes bacterium]|nr:carboxypeptidase regulatory-like domain-containing protein [Bacteroidota bacterium]
MKKLFILFTVLTIAMFNTNVHAQLQMTATGTTYTIDFDATVTGVNDGPYESVSGQPMWATPPAAGQMDANGWAYLNDGADTVTMNPAVFTGSCNANFATLLNGGVSSTGWGAWNISGNHAFAVCPSGAAATGGYITLKVNNNTGSQLQNLEISYYVAAFNDQARSNKVIFFYSTDNVTYTKVPAVTFISGLASTSSWEFDTKTVSLSGLSIPDFQSFYLRWVFSDYQGAGSRDEFMLDNITVLGTGSSSPVATNLAVTKINNGIHPSANEPFSVTIQSQNALGVATAVTASTVVTLALTTGTGALTGTIEGNIEPGNHSVTITGLLYDVAETGISITASSTLLASGTSDLFEVLPAANHFVFFNFPITATSGMNLISYLNAFQVQALRADNSVDSNYVGIVTISLFTGPGTMSGSTTKPTVVGIATFNNISLDIPGDYTLLAQGPNLADGVSPVVTIIPGPSMEELVVPQFIGSKSAATVNNCRTPFAICLNFSNLMPDTTYTLRLSLALTSEGNDKFGAGNTWSGTAFVGTNVASAFSTNSSGNTGPIWLYMQPTGNGTRFDAGMTHNLRVAAVPTGASMPIVPIWVGVKTVTALDIPITERTSMTEDDGAFVRGIVDTLMSGKLVLVYDNADGTGSPLTCFQIRTIEAYSTFANSDLPGSIDSVYRELPTGVKGVFAGVIPISDNNPNGVRRVEIRDFDNNIINFRSDADGIWPSGANTNNVIRRQVINLTADDLAIGSTITGTVTYGNTANTPMTNTTVQLFNQSNVLVKSAVTDANGQYVINGVQAGNYTLTATCTKATGGINAVDALSILKHFVGMITLTGIHLKAADVSGGIPVVNSLDALMVQKRFVGLITTFPVGDWVFEVKPVAVTDVTTYTVDLKALCTGDVNGSFIPALK